MIYFLFEPIKIKEQKFVDVPLLNMGVFTLYELDTKGLKTIMTGEKALRFSDRYTVDLIDYTNNSKEFVSNMKADFGIYKTNNVDLKGNCVYVREDGISFKSNTMHYNTATSIATTKDAYSAHKYESNMIGQGLVYNAELKQMKSKKVVIRYKLEGE